MNKLINNIVNKSEEIAFYILTSWCILPILMCFIDIYNAAAGNFPSEEELTKLGFYLGGVVFTLTLKIYETLFTIIGIITILFVLFCIINKSKTIFSKSGFKNWPWFYFLFAMFIWAFISCLQAEDITIAFKGGSYDYNGLFSFLVYISILLTASVINKQYLRKKITIVFSLMITFLSLIMFIQCFNIHFLDYCFPAIYSVVFNNSNHFAYLLCMAAIAYVALYLFDEKKFNYLYLLGFAFVLYCLLINNTFGSYIGLAVGFVFTYVLYLLRGNKLNLKSLLPLILFISISLLSVLNISSYSSSNVTNNVVAVTNDIEKVVEKQEGYQSAGSGRMILWEQTIEIIKIRPLFGIGAECVSNEYALDRNMTPHNEFLTYACYFGIPALLFYLASLVSLAINRFKNIKKLDSYIIISATCLFTYLVSSFFGNSVFNTAPYFWLFFGICCGSSNNEESLFLPETKEQTIRKSEPKKLIIILLVVVTIAALSLFWLNWINERDGERSDLSAMKVAYSMANYSYRNNSIELGEYWYDDENFTFIPINKSQPEGYGKGTDYNVNYSVIYNKANKTDFDYDGSLDYTNKVIKVALSLNNDKTLNISLVWE